MVLLAAAGLLVLGETVDLEVSRCCTVVRMEDGHCSWCCCSTSSDFRRQNKVRLIWLGNLATVLLLYVVRSIKENPKAWKWISQGTNVVVGAVDEPR